MANSLDPDQMSHFAITCLDVRRWLGGAKVSCILRQWGIQLILAYSWARPAIFVAGKDRGGMFLFLLFLHFHSCSSFFSVPLSSLSLSPTSSTISFLPFCGRQHKITHKGWHVDKPKHNQSINWMYTASSGLSIWILTLLLTTFRKSFLAHLYESAGRARHNSYHWHRPQCA